jgi:peptide/nickel transport system substrate-binding protein
VAGVQGGDLDIGYALPSDAIEAVRGRGAQVVTPVIGQSAAVYFRPASTEAGPIANKQVREAIAHAMDIDGIIRNTVGGIPQRNAQISGPDGFGYNPDLRGFPHNPARARELLAQAGFPNGFTTRLDTPIGRYLKDREISEAVAGQLSQVGVRMEVNTLEFAVYLQNFLNARLSPMFLAGVSYAPEMDINQPLAFFTSANSARIAADPAYDALYQRSAIEPNPQERERLLQQAMRQVHDEVWAVYFFQIPSINGVRPSAAGVGFRPDYSMDLSRWR